MKETHSRRILPFFTLCIHSEYKPLLKAAIKRHTEACQLSLYTHCAKAPNDLKILAFLVAERLAINNHYSLQLLM
jgi:hypothetical protein